MVKIIGIDTGIASVGWAVIDTNSGKIIDLGTRIFEAAEIAKMGHLWLCREEKKGWQDALKTVKAAEKK